MKILGAVLAGFIFLNSALAIFTLFREKERDISAIWAWFLVISMMPGIGFIIYLFLGRKISKEHIFDIRSQERIDMPEVVEAQKSLAKTEDLDVPESKFQEKTFQMIHLFLVSNESVLTKGNDVELISDGKEKFSRLLED